MEVMEYKNVIPEKSHEAKLYQFLDDIDTLIDIIKPTTLDDYNVYREQVVKIAGKRSMMKIKGSEGRKLFSLLADIGNIEIDEALPYAKEVTRLHSLRHAIFETDGYKLYMPGCMPKTTSTPITPNSL